MRHCFSSSLTNDHFSRYDTQMQGDQKTLPCHPGLSTGSQLASAGRLRLRSRSIGSRRQPWAFLIQEPVSFEPGQSEIAY